MKNEKMRLRAHHGMCLAFFEGKGYSAGFTAHMAKILERLEQENPTVEIVAEADCICRGCPNLTDGLCEKADPVARYDKAVLILCGIEEHSALPWRAFAARVTEYILSKGKRADICGNCQWSAICEGKEPLYRL